LDDWIARDWADLVGREHGPMTFRLVLQPLTAVVFAVRSGLRDAREGRPAFFWAAATDPGRRASLLRLGWADVGRLFVVAGALDVVYQILVLRWLYPGQALIVAAALAVVPYVAVRGVVTRVARRVWPRNGGHRRGV
jgi:hypothetical protein